MTAGSVVPVRFPFTRLEQAKKRPALVLSVVKRPPRIQLITFAMITSKLDGFALDGDVALDDWQKAKLLHPSLVRLSKIATAEDELIERTLGKLSEQDFKSVSKVFGRLFRDWI